MTASTSKTGIVPVFWSKIGIVVTIICAAVGFGAGFLVTRWVAQDAQEEYLAQLLTSAISELDYNLDLSWYKQEKHIASRAFYGALRCDALWYTYYHSNQLFGSGSAEAEKILNCLDEISWINRCVSAQYDAESAIPLMVLADHKVSQEEIDMAMQATSERLVILHQRMFDRYEQYLKRLMGEVRGYLSIRLKGLS